MRQFDEMYSRLPAAGDSGEVRAHYAAYARWLKSQDPQLMAARREEAEVIFRRVGITFAVYGDKDEDANSDEGGTERLIPFDLIPRVIAAQEWKSMEAGLVQRVNALNRFIHDVYHDQDILKAGIIPREQIENNAQFRPEMVGVDVSKQQQTSDWGAEVLTDAQKDYAASDVLYLHALKAQLEKRLIREGRMELAERLFAFLPTRAELDLMGWTDLTDIFNH